MGIGPQAHDALGIRRHPPGRDQASQRRSVTGTQGRPWTDL